MGRVKSGCNESAIIVYSDVPLPVWKWWVVISLAVANSCVLIFSLIGYCFCLFLTAASVLAFVAQQAAKADSSGKVCYHLLCLKCFLGQFSNSAHCWTSKWYLSLLHIWSVWSSSHSLRLFWRFSGTWKRLHNQTKISEDSYSGLIRKTDVSKRTKFKPSSVRYGQTNIVIHGFRLYLLQETFI